jgi:hypothetical protein
VNFANVGVGVNAPVFDIDGTTRLAGNQYMAQLLINGTAIATTPFLTGGNAGYFLGGTKVLTGVTSGSTVTATIQAWDTATGASFDAALNKTSADWQLTIVGDTAVSPNVPPAALVGMPTGLSLVAVPEPTTIALAILGGVALLFRRRK